jgi:two-component sensor histidine kinase
VAVALSMALHELATNAVKYGALACSGGRVVVRWTITADSEPRLELIWSEQGGPAVTEPEVRGFGTRLIERGLAFDIGGTARISFETSGVICVIEAPLGLVVAPARVVPFPRVGRAAMRG